MFCHKCGAKITEGSEFCHKCGTKVVSSETKSNTAITEESAKAEINSGNTNSASDDLIFVTIISVGNKKMDIIKALKDFFDITLAEAKEAAEEIPMLIKKPMSYTDAKRLKEILSELGADVSFSDTNGKPVNIQKSRTENDSILNDEKDFCSDRETPIHNNTTATENDDLKSKIPHSMAGLKNYFNSLSFSKKLLFLLAVFGGAILLFLLIIIVINIFKLIFSSSISFLITAAIIYFIYQRWGAAEVAKDAYAKEGQDLHLPDGMNSSSLLEALTGKFNYPYFKGIRYGEAGYCIIEGKYSEYPVAFLGNGQVKLNYSIKDKKENLRLILREAIAVRSYLNKFFNPSLPYDSMKDMKALKFAEKQQILSKVIFKTIPVIIGLGIILSIFFPDIMQPGASVRNAYLSQYSDTVTIEEAFDNFFANEKWRTYKDESYSYVVFTGTCQYMDDPADVKIVFKITGENFIVESMDINGVEQNDLIMALMLGKIYEDVN